MKLLFLLFSILLFPFKNVEAQHFAWMRTAPGTPRAMALDPEGNILFQTLADPVNGWQTHQLRLVSPAGELLWVRDYPQIGLMAPLKTDAGGNFWFPVEGHGTVTVDGITHHFEEARPHAIAKMSPKGQFLSFGFDSRFPMDFEFDPAGNLYLCGSRLLQKFAPSGNLLWDVPPVFFEGIGNEIGLVNGVEIVGGNRIVISGSFLYGQGLKARIADTSVLVEHSETMFFAGFDAEGNRKWLRAGGGVNVRFLLSSDQTGTLIAAGNPFHLDFDGWQLPYDGSTHGPAIVKFSAATGELLWHRNYPEWSWMNDLVPLADGSFYMAGQLRNIGDDDGNIPVGAAMYAREGNYQAFVARFGPDGGPRWLAASREGDFASLSGVLPAANGHVWLGGDIASVYGLRNTRFGSERLFQNDSTYGVIGLLLDTLAAAPPAATLNLQGKIFEDVTPDCQPGNGETGIADLSVLAEPGPFLAKTDANGNFRFRLPPGQYTLRPIERNNHSQRLTPLCKTTQNIDLQVDTTGINFPFQREDCTSLISAFEAGGYVYCVSAEPNGGVDSTTTLRVVFQNFGKQAIGPTAFKVEFPWPFYPISSEPAWSNFNVADSNLVFSFPHIAAGATDTVEIRFGFPCSDWWPQSFGDHWFFPFSAKFSGSTNDCFPEDTLANQLDFTIQYVIPVGTQNPGGPKFQTIVWPNPSAEGVFQVQAEVEGNVRWSVFDAFGRAVSTFENRGGTFEINLRDAPPGLYFLTGKTGKVVWSGKLLRSE